MLSTRAISSVQSLSHIQIFVTPQTAAQQAFLSITNSWSLLKPCPLSRWCHTTISSTVISFSSCPQSFPASGSFQMSQFFISGGQTIGVSASASVLPMTIQDWLPLGWTGLISLLSKGLSRVFSNKNSLPTDQGSPTTAIIYVKTCVMETCIMPDFNIFFPSSFSLEKHFFLF